MRKVFLLAFLIYSLQSFASPNLRFTEARGNVNIMYSYYVTRATMNRINLLADLINQLGRAKGDSTPIFFGYEAIALPSQKEYHTLGYDSINFINQQSPEINPTMRDVNGFKIHIQDHNIDIRKTLNLINYALDNREEVLRNQKWIEIDKGRLEKTMFFTISEQEIKSYQLKNTYLVDSLLLETVNLNVRDIKTKSNILSFIAQVIGVVIVIVATPLFLILWLRRRKHASKS